MCIFLNLPISGAVDTVWNISDFASSFLTSYVVFVKEYVHGAL